MNKPDVANMSIRELATVVLRGGFALLFPALLFAALAGVAAGVAVVAFRFTINLF